ncbi:MAG TPA: hypothetical protein VF041_02275 [Gemmatimonadaceae bacterium]
MGSRLRWRTLGALLLLAIVASAPLGAQGLREQISDLFIFGPGQDPLFLAGTADPNNPASIQAHGDHFVPAASAANGTMISFLTDAIGGNVANVPLGATSGSQTFRFEGGVPVKTSVSAGPVFGERAQTLGKGRILAGINRTSLHFESLRGVDLDDIQLTFTHENVNFPGCDTLFGGDCKQMGIPAVENDIMQFQLSLRIDVDVTSFYVAYGLLDRLDVGLVVPLVSTQVEGHSTAQIIPFGGPTATHFFAGTPENPVLSATRSTTGSSFGLGDVAVRLKLNVRQSPRTSVSLFGDARLPTGGEDDLLGSGSFSARGLAVFSARFGTFAPHLNAGYLYRNDKRQNDAVLGTLGFDQLLGDRVTMAVDLVSELQVGDSKLQLPGPVQYDAPFHRTITPTTIPNMRDDIFDGSFGFKFSAADGLALIANALFPLNEGGLRPGVSYTVGVEYGF